MCTFKTLQITGTTKTHLFEQKETWLYNRFWVSNTSCKWKENLKTVTIFKCKEKKWSKSCWDSKCPATYAIMLLCFLLWIQMLFFSSSLNSTAVSHARLPCTDQLLSKTLAYEVEQEDKLCKWHSYNENLPLNKLLYRTIICKACN